MAFNYTNLGSQLSLYGSLANGSAMSNPATLFGQLANAMAAAATAASATATVTSSNQTSQHTTSIVTPIISHALRGSTPEPPPAPKLGSYSPPNPMQQNQKNQINQGTAPMDLENECEMDVQPRAIMNSQQQTDSLNTVTTITPASGAAALAATAPPPPPPTTLATTAAVAALNAKTTITAVDKISINLHDPNLYINGLLSSAATAPGYMFFPAAAAAAATTGAATNAHGSMLMNDCMMAAAMQQLQQSYASGFAMPTADACVDGSAASANMKEMIKTRNCILYPPNPEAPPPTIRERPPGCRTVFVGGLPENMSDEIVREIFDSCGEISTLRMSKKNFCHIRYRYEASVDRAIYLSGYRVRITNGNEPTNFGRLHVDYAQARDDQYEYECKQRQLQREQRHRERISMDRLRSQSPPPIPHYSDHEASMVSDNLRSNETFIKAVQTITAWLERGDCTKRNANVFYSMIQSTHAHVRRLHTDKQQLEEDLRKSREIYRKQMLTMSAQFTQIEKVFSAASHKKVWDHFSKAQRKNIDQWKKLASDLRSVQIEDDEMEMSDEDRDYQSSLAKRARYDNESLREENDSLRCQLEALRNEMCMDRTDLKFNSDFREKQIKVLQETIRNMQTQVLNTKLREQKDKKTIDFLSRQLKEAQIKHLLMKTKIKETTAKLKQKEKVNSQANNDITDASEVELSVLSHESQTVADDFQIIDSDDDGTKQTANDDADNNDDDDDDDVRIIEDCNDEVEILDFDFEDKSNHANREQTEPASHEQQQLQPEQLDNKPTDCQKVQTNLIDLVKCANGNETKTLTDTNDEIETGNDEQSAEMAAKLQLLSQTEAKIIALAAAFLVVHPRGASLDLLCTYLTEMIDTSAAATVEIKHLEDILNKYNNIFKAEKESSLADGCHEQQIKTKWKFCGFIEPKMNIV